MAEIHEIRVMPMGDDPAGADVRQEAERALGVSLQEVRTAEMYRLQGVTLDEAQRLARELFVDPITQQAVVDPPDTAGPNQEVEVAYRPGVMNPAAASVIKAANDLGIRPEAADASRVYIFPAEAPQETVELVTGRLLVNQTVQHVVTHKPDSLIHPSTPQPVREVPIRNASADELRALSRDKLFLDDREMAAIQRYFRDELGRDPTDVELEIIAARWSEHCGHKTFNAELVVDGAKKPPLMQRIRQAAERHFNGRVLSAFKDNSGVTRFFDGLAICGKVETHNSPSAIEPYGGAMTGSGGVFRDIMGTGKGAKTIVSTDIFCLAPPDLDRRMLPNGTLAPDHLFRNVVRGVRDYGNRMGIPTGNGSVHFHPDYRAKPSVIVGAYGLLPEEYAEKGEPRVGDLVVVIGGRTGRDGLHGATFSSGEMTERTANVNASAVQIGNAIEQQRMFSALLAARDAGLVVALTDCGAAGFSSAIGEMGEHVGVTVDLSLAPLKYPGLSPWEILLSESQERMVAAIAPENAEAFLELCRMYNVEATILGQFDGSHRMTVKYGEETVADLAYEFLDAGLPQRTMEAHWERPTLPEIRPAMPTAEREWTERLMAVLGHGDVCSKESIIRQYDHGVQGGNVVAPYGGVTQQGPNDALVVRPLLDRPYGMVVAHGMNPGLNRIDPYEGTVWAFAEAAANYVAAGGDITAAAAVGNYIWPFPDREAMGSLDRSVDAAVAMMDVLGVPVVSGKDSLSSTFRGAGGEVIKIPPVYVASLFGPIPDVEQTMTTDIKQPGSTLVLIGQMSGGMAGSVYYDIAGGSSAQLPTIDTAMLPRTLQAMHGAIVGGKVLACHDVSEGGVAAAVAEMCFGGDCGAQLEGATDMTDKMDVFLFSETAGCFVVEVADEQTVQELFSGVPHRVLGRTTQEKHLEVGIPGGGTLFRADIDELKGAWQAPMKGVFHG